MKEDISRERMRKELMQKYGLSKAKAQLVLGKSWEFGKKGQRLGEYSCTSQIYRKPVDILLIHEF